MARSFGQIKVDIWRNEDFTALTPNAQRIYLYLTTQPKLSFAGVLSWRPKFAAKAARGLTVKDVEQSTQELEEASFVVVDDDTEELLVRSFIRHDDLLRSPNMTKAMVSDWRAIDSDELRGIVAFEVQRLAEENPSLNGLKNASEILESAPINPSHNPSLRGSETLPEGDAEQTQTHPQPQDTETAPAAAAVAAEFDQWYSEYPKKVGKEDARKAFARARKKVEMQVLVDGLARYKQITQTTERRFIAHPATWLNQGRWEDEAPSTANQNSMVPPAYRMFN